MFKKVKITVIDKKRDEKLANEILLNPNKLRICDVVEIGQEFIVDNPFEMPEGLCASAWADIRHFILTMASGGTFEFFKDPKVGAAICSDPFRPVTFRLERIDK